MTAIWPRSLKTQLLLALAVALLIAQGLSAALIYRAENERREAAVIHAAAFRLLSSRHDESRERRHQPPPEFLGAPRSLKLEQRSTHPFLPGERRDGRAEAELDHILAEMDFAARKIIVVHRDVTVDPAIRKRFTGRDGTFRLNRHKGRLSVLVAGVEVPGKGWLVARVLVPPSERGIVLTLIGQTLLIYLVLVGALALALRRITRPLAALASRVERFAATQDADGQLEPEGPDDVRRLIVAHNAMEARIAALLNEKDVMLGAIGHDLKTPLAALRVRIESVDDDGERAKMAATIEDIVRTLDDILSLARVGRPRDPREPTELYALVASVVEEYEDMEQPVTLGDAARLVLPLRATWMRRALRNLIGNALRYGQRARVDLARENGWALVRIDDDGPGIPEERIAEMQEPFTRGEPSRNSETGGAGLGLALARAIAEQHGGRLDLANRREAGRITGLRAELRLPLD